MKKTISRSHTHTANNEPQGQPQYSEIKLGIDVHADSYRVVRQIEHATPQPAQKFTLEKFLKFAAEQGRLARVVYCCYEAGPFGYSLHRALLKLGLRNVVVRPQNWDELGKGVKTDKTDALALVQRLDRYVRGNTKALAVITVPTLEQEKERTLSRRREQLQRDRQAREAQGRSLMLYQGHRIKGQWWRAAAWEKLTAQLADWLVEVLAGIRTQIVTTDDLLQKLGQRIEKEAKPQAKGFGRLTSEMLRREVLDWHRFQNRRQVASLTGMCPRVRASGFKSVSGSINKHGNPRIRRLLVELAWRVMRYQPDYPPVKRWQSQLQAQHKGGRKKAAIAIGRKLAIDLWRMETGRVSPAKLNLR